MVGRPAPASAEAGTPSVSLSEILDDDVFDDEVFISDTSREDYSARVSPGFYVTPSVSISEIYDDNIFISETNRADYITRVSPGLTVGYRSDPLTLLGTFAFDISYFALHSELNKQPVDREAYGLDLSYQPDPRLMLGLTGAFTKTERPGELEVETGIESERRRTTQYRFSPSVSYRFDPRTLGNASYRYTSNEKSGGVSGTIQKIDLSLSRAMTAVDTGTLGYGFALFESDGSESTSSHNVTLGWARQLTGLTLVSLRAGPRFSDGEVDAEASASLRHSLRQGHVLVEYVHTQTTVIGRAGTQTTDRLSASLAFDATRELSLDLSPAVRQISAEDAKGSREIHVYGMSAGAKYRITRWLDLRADYRFSFRHEGNVEILHNTITIGLDFLYIGRVY